MPNGLKIESLEIKGFRSFNLPRKFELEDARFILLIGPIGSGKSSVLKAIEYALYGSSYEITRLGLIRLKHEDMVNDFSDLLNIELILKGEHRVRIVRGRKRGRPGRLRVYLDNMPVKNDVERFLRDVIMLDHEDFLREIVIHHLILRDIVEGGPVRRSIALDRLFGIELLEQSYKSIPLTMVEKKILEYERKIGELNLELAKIGTFHDPERIKSMEIDINRLRNRIETLQREHKQVESMLSEIEETELRRKLLLERYYSLKSQLEEIDGKLDRVEEISTVEIISDIEDVLENARSLFRDMLYEEMAKELYKEPRVVLKEDIIEKLNKILLAMNNIMKDLEYKLDNQLNERIEYKRRYDVLRGKQIDLESEIEKLIHYRYEYTDLVKKYGLPDDISKRIEEYEAELLKLGRKNRQLKNIWDLLKVTIDRIELEKRTKCPICGKELVSEDLENMRRRRKEIEEKDLVNIIRKMEEIESNINELKDILNRIRGIEENIRRLEELELEKEELERKITKISNLLHHAEENIHIVKDKMRRARYLKERLSDLIEKLTMYFERKSLLERRRDIQKNLESIKEELEKLRYEESRYLKLKKRKEELEKILFEDKVKLESLLREYEKLKKDLEKAKDFFKRKEQLERKLEYLRKLYKYLENVRKLLREVQADLRVRMLKRIRSNMNKTFKQLYVHPDLVEVDIRAVETPKRSVYEIYVKRGSDGTWIPIYSKLSDGQRLMIALSLLLSIYKLYPHNIDFILLDEPFANINGECRRSILKLLANTESPSQIFIATQDESIIDLVKEIVGKDNMIAYKLTYGGIEGPKVTRIC